MLLRVLERGLSIVVLFSAAATTLLLARPVSSPETRCEKARAQAVDAPGPSTSLVSHEHSERNVRDVSLAPAPAPAPVRAGVEPAQDPPQCLTVERVAPAREALLAAPMLSALRRCREGAVDSCHGLAQRFEEADPALSTEAWTRACLGGDLHACALLGHRVAEGSGVNADLDAGVAILRATCAATPTGCFYLTLQLQRREPEEALAAATRGCQVGSAIQCLQAGQLAEEGVSGASPSEAAAWFDTACELGHREGCEALLNLAESGRIPTTAPWLETARRRACAVGVHDACGTEP